MKIDDIKKIMLGHLADDVELIIITPLKSTYRRLKERLDVKEKYENAFFENCIFDIKESRKGIVYDNFVYMMQWILENTECAIALIPHVVWEDNDDRTVLRELYNKFKNTGRVVLIDDCNCMQLKGYISRCRFFVGARTHATIAAYSTRVPTLVLGYSIKSRGIAKDLFGREKNYVISVQDLRKKENLF